MKAREEHRLSTLRMVKTALKNKEIDKMAPLDDKEIAADSDDADQAAQRVRRAVHQGGRQEMADKEAAEIKLIETYLPKEAGRKRSWPECGSACRETGPLTMKTWAQ